MNITGDWYTKVYKNHYFAGYTACWLFNCFVIMQWEQFENSSNRSTSAMCCTLCLICIVYLKDCLSFVINTYILHCCSSCIVSYVGCTQFVILTYLRHDTRSPKLTWCVMALLALKLKLGVFQSSPFTHTEINAIKLC